MLARKEADASRAGRTVVPDTRSQPGALVNCSQVMLDTGLAPTAGPFSFLRNITVLTGLQRYTSITGMDGRKNPDH